MHPGEAWRAAVAAVRSQSIGEPLGADVRITVHFHPDRSVDGIAVLERVADGGSYLPQFVTGISNGGLTAHPGGDRWAWESRIFHGAYDRATAEERPVYGALEHRGGTRGGAIRFGSCWFELRRSVWDRVTLCWPDSAASPELFGTPERAGDPLRAADAAAAGPLDDDVEAHLHGGFVVARDAVRLVLDPSFRGTRVEAAAARSGVPVAWHAGLVLDVRRPDLEGYRGAAPLALARDLAVDGRLDARTLGAAADEHDPQLVKRAWHLIARFGEPAP